MGIAPHDLLRLDAPDAVEAIDPPDWVLASLATAPWVVVRRAGDNAGRIAVGVRGSRRAERFAAHLPRSAVAETVRAEDLADRKPPRAHAAFSAIEMLRPVLDEFGAPWGPVGAAGFELATGRATLTDDSDLDLVLRLDQSPDLDALAHLAEAAAGAALRVDILMELPQGAVAFEEFRAETREVLLRTPQGPRLIDRAELWPAC